MNAKDYGLKRAIIDLIDLNEPTEDWCRSERWYDPFVWDDWGTNAYNTALRIAQEVCVDHDIREEVYHNDNDGYSTWEFGAGHWQLIVTLERDAP
jgi:hypothetical protein